MSSTTITYNSKAVKLSRKIHEDICRGEYSAGSLLPAQYELALKYHVSRETLHRSLSILQSEGKIQMVQGRILVPSAPVEKAVSDGGSLAAAPPPTRSERKLTIAAVWASEPDMFLIEMRKGILQYASEAGLTFKVFLTSGGHEKTLAMLRNIEQFQIDGVIILPFAHPDYASVLRQLVGKRFPLVSIDRQVDSVETSSVEADNAAGMYEAVHYLISKYDSPVYYVTSQIEHSVHRDRLEGYRHAMIDAGYGQAVNDMTCMIEVSDTDPAYWPKERKHLVSVPIVEKLLDQVTSPINVACLNDYLAQGVYEAAARRHMVIGRDIRVTGFSDIPLARLLTPGLTTVRQPGKQMGYEAAKLLHQLTGGNVKSPVHVHLPVELAARESA